MEAASVQVSKPPRIAKWPTQDDDMSKKLSFFKGNLGICLYIKKQNQTMLLLQYSLAQFE